MISKEKLDFDPTDSNTVADSDSIGAYVRAGSDGDLIASQTINSEEWLNTASVLHDENGAVINDSNPLPVDVKSSISVNVDLDHTEDSVRLGDGTNYLTSTTVGTDIGLDVYLINSSLTVTATDLDIRDLDYNSDSVTVYQGTNPWVVSATDLDIRDLTHVSDSVKLGDGTNLFTSHNVGSNYGLDVYALNDPSVADTSVTTEAKSATSTQSALVSSVLSNRKFLIVQNLGNRKVYIAESGATDAAATGLRLSSGAVAEFRLGANVNLDVKAAGGTQDVRILQAS